MAKNEEELSKEAYNRLLNEVRNLHKDLSDVRAALARAGLESLTTVGAINTLLKSKDKLDEATRLISNPTRKPEDTVHLLWKLLKE